MRRDDRRVVAGVCSGFAYRLGVDPNVVRVVTVVLALFGGAGVLLYALGWLLLPEASTGRSLAERALRGGGVGRGRSVLLALALVVVAIGAGLAVGDSWLGITVLAVAAIIGGVLVARRPQAPTPLAGPGSGPGSELLPEQGLGPELASGQAYPWTPAPQQSTPPAGLAPSMAPGTSTVPFAPRPDAGASFAPRPVSAPPVAAPPLAAPPVDAPPVAAPPVERAPRRPRSWLGPLTVFAAVAAVGVTGLVDALGASVPMAAYVAAPLAVVALGLLVGAWYGRSRGLIALGIALVVLLVPIATVERLGLADVAGESFESVRVAPTSTDQLDGTVVEYPAGDVTYDLTGLDFEGEDVDLEIQMAAGALDVSVPAEVDVVLDAEVAAGQITAFGQESSGLGVSTTRTFDAAPPAAGDDGGTLRLVVRMGLGNVEVDRDQA